MPLPWKKSKVATISRLVTDLHHHSPKRGNSLVVQTGFPASLVDLFYKNRDRLKKPYSSSRSKNRKRNQSDEEFVISDPVLTDPIDGGAESSGIDEIQEVVEEKVSSSSNERVQQIHKDRTRKRMMKKLVKRLRHRKKGTLTAGGDKEDEIVAVAAVKRPSERSGLGESGNRKAKLLLISDVLENRMNSECEEDGILIADDDDDDDDDGECCLTSGELQSESSEINNSRRSGGNTNSGCVILLLAVLVGLAGGRLLALMITIVACLMLKFAGRRRSSR